MQRITQLVNELQENQRSQKGVRHHILQYDQETRSSKRPPHAVDHGYFELIWTHSYFAMGRFNINTLVRSGKSYQFFPFRLGIGSRIDWM